MEKQLSKLKTEIITINPKELKLLDVNARFMKHETFQRLVDNIRQDGKLTQLPFAMLDEDGKYKVLSGNHRTQAAIEVGLDEIEVMVTNETLGKDRQMAIQLSHNSISGEDDPAILKALYEDIQEIDMKMYAGLDDKMLGLLQDVRPMSIGEMNLDFQTMSIVFLPDELERAKVLWEEFAKTVNNQEIWIARFSEYDQYLNTMETISASYNVTNIATNLHIMLKLVNANLDIMSKAWYDEETQTTERQRDWVPIASILNQDKLPPMTGAMLKKATDRLISQGEITRNEKYKVIEHLAAEFLGKDGD